MDAKLNKICVCILAYNEEKHIAETIYALLRGNDNVSFDIVVYANGCTDRTVEIVETIRQKETNVYIRELSEASKPNAWNIAFRENKNHILCFSDGDVVPEKAILTAVIGILEEQSKITLVGCEFWPLRDGLNLSQRITGFLQIPFGQDFLSGQFYAIRRTVLNEIFLINGIDSIPKGIVGEDAFLESLVPDKAFGVARAKVYYEPPNLRDYQMFLARMRWQNEQLKQLSASLSCGMKNASEKTEMRGRVKSKINQFQGVERFIIGLIASSMRLLFKFIFSKRITACYEALGPVSIEGNSVLASKSRASSSK